jgi:hypothetical protein
MLSLESLRLESERFRVRDHVDLNETRIRIKSETSEMMLSPSIRSLLIFPGSKLACSNHLRDSMQGKFPDIRGSVSESTQLP